jgi:hypothetical protein
MAKYQVQCIGIVRHMMETDAGDDGTRIGIEFSDLSSVTRKTLENFLYSCVTAESKESQVQGKVEGQG